MKLVDLLEEQENSLIGKKIKVSNGSDFATRTITTDRVETWPIDFKCRDLKLNSLKGCPKHINGSFICEYNNLTSLEGCPETVKGIVDIGDNKLTSLKDIHKHLKEIDGSLWALNNPIKSHVFGVLLIKGCNRVGFSYAFQQDAMDILNKYLPNTRGHAAVAECQDELIEADLDEFAQI